jgi:hypothetical protein
MTWWSTLIRQYGSLLPRLKNKTIRLSRLGSKAEYRQASFLCQVFIWQHFFKFFVCTGQHVGQIWRNFSHSCGLVLSADNLHKMASSVQNAKRSICHRKTAGKCRVTRFHINRALVYPAWAGNSPCRVTRLHINRPLNLLPSTHNSGMYVDPTNFKTSFHLRWQTRL